MNTFVKIKDYPNWFLMVAPNGEFDDSLRLEMTQRAIRNEIKEGLNNPHRSAYETQLRVNVLSTLRIDYVKQATEQGKDMLVRNNGSYMPLFNVEDIEEVKESDDWPK